ncbi:hypothetical protein J2X36_000798 [Methylobacterium sp. BE186]|uniref:hypothetical protein n=1 Tax=Methylobacterium sp. BE186 TaxID=2817715 RepID=UPI0028633CFB|nr:hypothetical protein [Methylobacterium sp. BE186]MDR7036062.1 hypothetical protein [Methylobacterium sp. BE186]
MNENLPPQIQTALAECISGAHIAERKADDYLKLSRGEADDSIYEACRSMHRFYSSMHEFFREEQRAISALLKTDRGAMPSQVAAAVR